MPACKNCQSDVLGSFCGNCGQKVIARFTLTDIKNDLIATFVDVDRGFFFTFKSLVINPASVIQDWWAGKTVPYFHPMRFMFILTTVSSLVMIQFGVLDANESQEASLSEKMTVVASQAKQFAFEYLHILMMLSIPIKAWLTKKMFKDINRNLAEHIYMQCYVYGTIQGVFIPLNIIIGLTHPFDNQMVWRIGTQLMQMGMFAYMTYGLLTSNLIELGLKSLLFTLIHFLTIFVFIGLVIFSYILILMIISAA